MTKFKILYEFAFSAKQTLYFENAWKRYHSGTHHNMTVNARPPRDCQDFYIVNLAIELNTSVMTST